MNITRDIRTCMDMDMVIEKEKDKYKTMMNTEMDRVKVNDMGVNK